MKKLTSLFLLLAIIASVCALSTTVFASSTHTVKINGIDKLQITNVTESTEAAGDEGIDTEGNFICKSGAKLINLENNAITLVFDDVGSGNKSPYMIPDGYKSSDLNEYGQFFDLPKGGSYTFTNEGMYYYHIQFADGTSAIGYIEIMDGYEPVSQSPSIPAASEKPEPIAVVSKVQRVQIEEEWADVDAYNIYDNNYIKLRDFAYYYSMFCSHMDKWFDVTWDGEKNAINLIRGKEYKSVGGEGTLNAGVSATAVLSSASVYLDGEYILLTAYNINGNNYFKLRDLCEALDISISWWGEQKIIYINNDYGYGTEFGEIVPDIIA